MSTGGYNGRIHLSKVTMAIADLLGLQIGGESPGHGHKHWSRAKHRALAKKFEQLATD